MKARLVCPTCGARLWVGIATTGTGHHAEAWPAHACVPAAAAPAGRVCMDCGGPMQGRPGLARRCADCAETERLRIRAVAAERERQARERLCATCGERRVYGEGQGARYCAPCRRAAKGAASTRWQRENVDKVRAAKRARRRRLRAAAEVSA